eukprot:COSAG05_NODE_12277_length_474_cov_1.541333_1_plen_38_part_10
MQLTSGTSREAIPGRWGGGFGVWRSSGVVLRAFRDLRA